MITNDQQIDRRIIQQAVTLQTMGHHVILIAGSLNGLSSFEWIQGVRVERFVATPLAFFDKVVSNIFHGIFRGRIDRFLKSRHPKHSSFEVESDEPQESMSRILRLLLLLLPRRHSLSFSERSLLERVKFYSPDIMHVHDLPQLRLGSVAAKIFSVPLVYDAHELYTEIGTLSKFNRFKLRRIENRYIKSCSAVTTVNPYIAAEMANRYEIEMPRVILNTLSFERPPQPENILRLFLDLPIRNEIVLYQGWMSPERGLDLLITAFSRVKDSAHLVFMGYGDCQESLKNQCKVLGIENRVHFVPPVPQDELLAWTMCADVGVIPYPAIDLNHKFCSPNKLFEFIHAQVPIVANDLPFLRDVIVGEGIGVVAPIQDCQAFASAIESCLERALSLDEIYPAALVSARIKFSWSSQENILRSIFNGLLT